MCKCVNYYEEYITIPNFSSRSILSDASSRIISWSSSVFYKISQALKLKVSTYWMERIMQHILIFVICKWWNYTFSHCKKLAMETLPLFEVLLFASYRGQVQPWGHMLLAAFERLEKMCSKKYSTSTWVTRNCWRLSSQSFIFNFSFSWLVESISPISCLCWSIALSCRCRRLLTISWQDLIF